MVSKAESTASDMEDSSASDKESSIGEPLFDSLPTDVSKWRDFTELAYWKARALSLQYENDMLHAMVQELSLGPGKSNDKGTNTRKNRQHRNSANQQDSYPDMEREMRKWSRV